MNAYNPPANSVASRGSSLHSGKSRPRYRETVFIPPRPRQSESDVATGSVKNSQWPKGILRLHGLAAATVLLLGTAFIKHASAQTTSPGTTPGTDSSLNSNYPPDIQAQQATRHLADDFEPHGSGTLYLQNRDNPSSTSNLTALTLDSDVQMVISGLIANVKYKQGFENRTNGWMEGIYSFPLPDNAAITSLEIQVGERVIKGQIKEKSTAKKIYDNAAQSGQVASLVSQQRANFFTTRIANIGPGEQIRISLDYVQTLELADDRYSVRLPTTFTPRYSNSNVADAGQISPPQIDATAQYTPILNLDIAINSQSPLTSVESPSHAIATENLNNKTVIQLAETTPMNSDFILRWSTLSENKPAINTFTEVVDDELYSLSVINPPKLYDQSMTQARELILVVDTSGSMGGTSIRAAKAALQSALSGLHSEDLFNIIEFNSHTRSLWPAPQSANANNISEASRFIRRLSADGGTEMEPALQQALANRIDGYLRQIVFVTDGAVGYEEHLFRMIRNNLAGARLFTVGIGSAPNSYFMRKAAQAGRGTFTYIAQLQDVKDTMQELFVKLETPVLTNLEIEWFGEPGEYFPSPLQDLYLGEPVIVAAKTGENTTGFRIHGNRGNTTWEEFVSLNNTAAGASINTIWARKKIEQLVDEQTRQGNEQHREEITQTALTHQLVSRYTSLVAVEEQPARPELTPVKTAKVANLLPAGSTMIPVNVPTGAAGADTLTAISLISALLASFLGWMMRASRRRTIKLHIGETAHVTR